MNEKANVWYRERRKKGGTRRERVKEKERERQYKEREIKEKHRERNKRERERWKEVCEEREGASVFGWHIEQIYDSLVEERLWT